MRLSVILPCYNMEKYLKRCLDSIARQGIDDMEVICVNDGSKDNTHGVFDAFKYSADGTDLHPNYRMIDQENQGVSVARNTGIDMAQGDYIALVDPDDEVVDGGLKALLDCAEKYDSPDLVIGSYETVMHDGSIRESLISSEDCHRGIDTPAWVYEKVPGEYLGAPWTKIFKRDILRSNKLYYTEGMVRHQDTEFNLRLLPYLNSVALTPHFVYKYYLFNLGGASGSFKGQRQIDALLTFYHTEGKVIDTLFSDDRREFYKKDLLRKLSFCFLSAIYVTYASRNINRYKSLKLICKSAAEVNPKWTDNFKSGNPRIIRAALKFGYRPTHWMMQIISQIPFLGNRLHG